jgi:cold shock CspA family protein
MEASPALEEQIRARAAELDQFFDRILSCRVTVELEGRQHRHGSTFHVGIELAVPGENIFITRDPGKNHAHEDAYVAARDAFNAARRRLQDHVRKMEGDVKTHESPTFGRIARVFAERHYCFLETADGAEVYVHRNAVAGNHFDTLKVGDRVRYVMAPDAGEQGPQASTVVPV